MEEEDRVMRDPRSHMHSSSSHTLIHIPVVEVNGHYPTTRGVHQVLKVGAVCVDLVHILASTDQQIGMAAGEEEGNGRCGWSLFHYCDCNIFFAP